MKKMFCATIYFMIVLFFFAFGTLKAQTSMLSWTFGSDTLGYSFAHIGWSPSDIQAVVANDPVNSGHKVLKNTIHNYNAAPVLQYILPAGKTLADFSSFTFKGYFAQGDVGYKNILVEAYQTMPTAQFANNASAQIGSWDRAQMGSTNWENITVNITNTSTFTDTIYVAFGINCAGTGSVGAAGDTTIWYADSVTLVPTLASNPSAIFASSKNSIDFGSDSAVVAKKDNVKIYDPGTDTLKVTSISSTNALFMFSPSVLTIAPSDSSTLTITFTPVDTSSQSGFIILTHNAAGSPDSISVKGKGIGSLPIVTNGSFESSNTGIVDAGSLAGFSDSTSVKGWLIQVATDVNPLPVFEIVSDTVEQGSRALKVTVKGAGTNQWDIQAVAIGLPVTPGATYNYSVWAKAAKAGAQVNFTVGNYAFTEYKAIRPAILGTQWQQFTMQFTVNDNQAVIRAPIHFSYAVDTGNVIYIDNLQIVENTPADTNTVWKGPALAAGLSKFLGCSYDPGQEPTFLNYWNQVTPENAGKFGSVAASADSSTWNWTPLDSCYSLAVNNHLVFKDHNLVWGAQQPGWISSGLDSAQQEAAIEQWIRMVGRRYPKMDMIDVVNEPIHTPPNGTNGNANYIQALGGTGATGWDWVIWAYQKAREYMPANTKLLINEYNILNSASSTATYIQIINLLKARNLIDGIGIQAHRFETESTDTNLIKSNLSQLAATGLPIYISEMDLGNLNDSGTPNDATQLQLYQKIFPIFWQYPAIKGITLWGYVQGLTWQTTVYLVRSDGTARRALLWLANYIENNPLGVKETASTLPSRFELDQNYPNPFNPSTIIRYQLPAVGHVTLKVYDVLGRVVETLVDGKQNAGYYNVTFTGDKLSSGVYFYELRTDHSSSFKKMLLLK